MFGRARLHCPQSAHVEKKILDALGREIRRKQEWRDKTKKR